MEVEREKEKNEGCNVRDPLTISALEPETLGQPILQRLKEPTLSTNISIVCTN